MLTNFTVHTFPRIRIAKVLILLFMLQLIASQQTAHSQAVFENIQNGVYEFLDRQAQKGRIELDDMIRPLTRNNIASYLNNLSELQKNQPSFFSKKEISELNFYIKEFGRGGVLAKNKMNKEIFFKRDLRGRFRFSAMIDSATTNEFSTSKTSKQFQFNLEPIVQGSIRYGQDTQSIITRTTGVQFWASLGKRWGIQSYFRDINENGKGIDFLKDFTADQGVIPITNPKPKNLNYSDVRATVTYEWDNGILAIGKEQYVLGYGVSGNIIYSNKAPLFPYLRVKQRILPWLKFEYTHAILSSGLVDTPNSYRVSNGGAYGGQRFKLIPKYLVSHAFTFNLKKGLDLMLGESVIYSDKLQFGYFLPFMYYKGWDQYFSGNNLNAGANAQIFAQISSRNQLKYTHLYGAVMVDEIRPTEIFNPKKSRNQVAFNIGASLTDLPYLPFLTVNFDYTRINPFVYQNLLPTQTYTSSDYILGDWIGSNAERKTIQIKYTPIPRLRLMFQYQKIRKGDQGTVNQQYFQEPQPEFLFNLKRKQWSSEFSAKFELIHNFYLHLNLARNEIKTYGSIFHTQTYYFTNAGFALGL